MANKINEEYWLAEFDIPPMGGQPDMGAGGPPMSQPGGPGDPMGAEPPQNPNEITPNPGTDTQDITTDPQYPDMPEEDQGSDFEVWKIEFVKESIKGDPNVLIDMIQQIRDRDLSEIDAKFVEDNLHIQLLRRNPVILEATLEIRKLVKKDLDQTNPGVRLLEHLSVVLEKYPLLNEVFIKTSGLAVGKSDAHRKLLAALLGAVQVGVGASEEDLVFEETDYSIRISTRFNATWGNVNLGRWTLKEDDPERYLEGDTRRRLEGGSPEEKDVIRRRVIIESIAEQFRERAFLIDVVGTDGTIQHLAWDLGTSLKTAFLDGKLVVRTDASDTREAFLDENGSIVPIPRVSIYYVKEAMGMSETGKAEIEELEFMACRDGSLYLTAPLDLIKESSVSLNGMLVKESPWQGNPSDMFRLKRCNPSLPEMILRDCQ